MSEERNILNVYNQFEIIKKAVDQLETIHVYELNARQWGDADTPSLKAEIADLDKKILEYELQLEELQNYLDSINESNNVLLKANNKLIEINKLISEKCENSQDEIEKNIKNYNKLPRIVRKLFGV